MGRDSAGKGNVDKQGALFSPEACPVKRKVALLLMPGSSGLDPRAPPLHTNAKSRLIAEYLSTYQMVTHGGLYIDGFAAPQSRDFREAWTARRVLELEPKWIRHFWLCDMDPGGVEHLKWLKEQHAGKPKGRTVSVMKGDFNSTVRLILKSPKLRRATPVFALLDQRNTECHWATVQAIAARAGRRKIEMLYFLGTSWLHRSLTQSYTPTRLAEITRWWGGDGWRDLVGATQAHVVNQMAHRFASELGYQHVTPWPVFNNDKGQRRIFYLIHASDHEEAPKLMKRAYAKIIGRRSGTLADAQSSLF